MDDTWVLQVKLPGVKKGDIDIQLEGTQRAATPQHPDHRADRGGTRRIAVGGPAGKG